MTNELNLFCFILNLSISVFIGALLLIMPILTRKSYLFGVKIPLNEYNCIEAKRIQKNYSTICIIGSAMILLLVILQYVIAPNMSLIAAMYFPFLFLILQMMAFIPNWKQATRLKQLKNWKVSDSIFAETKSSHSRGTLSELPWIWYIIGFILIIISVVILLVRYPSLPEQIPTHFDMHMKPDAWSDKTLWTIFNLPLINLGTLLLLWLSSFMLVRAKLQIDPQNPALSFAQHRIYRKRLGHSLGLLALSLVVLFILLEFMSIFPAFNIPFWLMMFFALAPSILLIFVLVKSGQGGCRIKLKEMPDNPTEQDNGAFNLVNVSENYNRGDDKYWAIGMFYYNKDDPAYIVEDRFGTNLGFNYARLVVQIGVAILTLLGIACYVWATGFILSSL